MKKLAINIFSVFVVVFCFCSSVDAYQDLDIPTGMNLEDAQRRCPKLVKFPQSPLKDGREPLKLYYVPNRESAVEVYEFSPLGYLGYTCRQGVTMEKDTFENLIARVISTAGNYESSLGNRGNWVQNSLALRQSYRKYTLADGKEIDTNTVSRMNTLSEQDQRLVRTVFGMKSIILMSKDMAFSMKLGICMVRVTDPLQLKLGYRSYWGGMTLGQFGRNPVTKQMY